MTIISSVTGDGSYRSAVTNARLSVSLEQDKFSSFLKLTMEPISHSCHVIKFDNYPDFINNASQPSSAIKP